MKEAVRDSSSNCMIDCVEEKQQNKLHKVLIFSLDQEDVLNLGKKLVEMRNKRCPEESLE